MKNAGRPVRLTRSELEAAVVDLQERLDKTSWNLHCKTLAAACLEQENGMLSQENTRLRTRLRDTRRRFFSKSFFRQAS